MTSEDNLTTEEHESRQQILVFAKLQLNERTCPQIVFLADHEFHCVISRLPFDSMQLQRKVSNISYVFTYLVMFSLMVIRKDRKPEIGVESLRPN